jgi:nucleoside-diphosphate-sugar epimerase
MRVFVVGATGVIGRRLVPQLIERGHDVVATFRSSTASAERLRVAGAEIVPLDLLDDAAVRRAVSEAKPDAIVHEATALSGGGFSRKLDKTFALSNQLRTVGTDALLAAALDAGVERVVAQSFAPYRYVREGGMVKTEEDPLDPTSPKGAHKSTAAMGYLDRAVTDFGGIALRYGGFYGEPDDQIVRMVRKRRYPMIGDGGGVVSWVHLDDAAAATVLAIDHAGPAIYNIVDDEPAAASEWLPVLADALGAKPPRHFPAWIVKLLVGEDTVMGATQSRGASNAKAKRELGWKLRYPTWRVGFFSVHSPTTPGSPPRTKPDRRVSSHISPTRNGAPTGTRTKKGS